ncbi:MAG TPA: hypothetical protein VGT81_04185 [Casimicrobiaceae bacterium]|nr:hypothetical protein [Casimicrobiaceae bacterium]
MDRTATVMAESKGSTSRIIKQLKPVERSSFVAVVEFGKTVRVQAVTARARTAIRRGKPTQTYNRLGC